MKYVLANTFPLNKFPMNCYFPIFKEILLSLSDEACQNFYDELKHIPERELNHLIHHYDLDNIERVIVVGAGAIPFTALFFSRHLKSQVFAVERNLAAYLACSRLMRKLNAAITVVRQSGEFYHYENSLTIITLHTRLKQKVLDSVLSSKGIVVVRLPLGETKAFDDVNLTEIHYSKVEHKTAEMASIFINH